MPISSSFVHALPIRRGQQLWTGPRRRERPQRVEHPLARRRRAQLCWPGDGPGLAVGRQHEVLTLWLRGDLHLTDIELLTAVAYDRAVALDQDDRAVAGRDGPGDGHVRRRLDVRRDRRHLAITDPKQLVADDGEQRRTKHRRLKVLEVGSEQNRIVDEVESLSTYSNPARLVGVMVTASVSTQRTSCSRVATTSWLCILDVATVAQLTSATRVVRSPSTIRSRVCFSA